MKLLCLLLSFAAITASAAGFEKSSGGSTNPDKAACTAAAGTFMAGTVTSSPRFASGSYLKGVELSHTHVNLKNDADGKTYDIAIDDVYATGYDQAGESVPAPLSSIKVGNRLELCGEPFPGGMHWVHSNCGITPTKTSPNGWVKLLNAQGVAGANMEGSQEYCYLWN